MNIGCGFQSVVLKHEIKFHKHPFTRSYVRTDIKFHIKKITSSSSLKNYEKNLENNLLKKFDVEHSVDKYSFDI